MKENSENLSSAELSSVDAMIAYMHANDKSSLKADFDTIFGITNNNCYNNFSITDTVFAVPATTGNCISGWIGNVVAAANQAAANTGGVLKTSQSADSAFFEKLANGKNQISLEELISLRNSQK